LAILCAFYPKAKEGNPPSQKEEKIVKNLTIFRWWANLGGKRNCAGDEKKGENAY